MCTKVVSAAFSLPYDICKNGLEINNRIQTFFEDFFFKIAGYLYPADQDIDNDVTDFSEEYKIDNKILDCFEKFIECMERRLNERPDYFNPGVMANLLEAEENWRDADEHKEEAVKDELEEEDQWREVDRYEEEEQKIEDAPRAVHRPSQRVYTEVRSSSRSCNWWKIVLVSLAAGIALRYLGLPFMNNAFGGNSIISSHSVGSLAGNNTVVIDNPVTHPIKGKISILQFSERETEKVWARLGESKARMDFDQVIEELKEKVQIKIKYKQVLKELEEKVQTEIKYKQVIKELKEKFKKTAQRKKELKIEPTVKESTISKIIDIFYKIIDVCRELKYWIAGGVGIRSFYKIFKKDNSPRKLNNYIFYTLVVVIIGLIGAISTIALSSMWRG